MKSVQVDPASQAERLRLRREREALVQARREIERQKAQAEARQELLGIVTHELKTPVAVLRAYTELLLGRAEAAGRREEAELLARMEDQAERLLVMVEQVLDLQRLDAGLFPLEIGRVELGALTARVLEGLQLTAQHLRLRVEAPNEVWVRADRRRIEQVLINLVQNAIRFSPDGAEVVVGLRLRNDLARERVAGETSAVRTNREPDIWAEVSVADLGPGVADADRARIFSRFYQGREGTALYRGHGGLGVGLYIAREIVTRHGGELWLEDLRHSGPNATSNGKGTGATFTFTLPVSGPDEGE